MFTVYANDKLLYSPTLIHDNYVISKPILTKELNKAGSFKFLLPPNNVMYDELTKLKTFITVYEEADEIFRGRILSDEKDFYKQKQVYCEGDLSFLQDSIHRPFSYTGGINAFFEDVVTNHNSQVESDKQFRLGEITVVDPNDYINRSSIFYLNTMDAIEQKLIDIHGGYIRTRKGDGCYYLDYLADYNSISSQVIEFGKNLLDITEYVTAENIFTCLIPLGAYQTDENGDETTERLTIESVNNGLDYIQNDAAIALFGKIWATNNWDDVYIASNLLTKGKAYLESYIDMAVSLNVKAIDLHLLDVDTAAIHLGDTIRVLSYPHGLDKNFLCSKIKMNLQNPEETEFTLGTSFKTLTQQQLDLMKKQN